MKIIFTSEKNCDVMIRDTNGWHWKLAATFDNIQSAIDMAENIFSGLTIWTSQNISRIFITDVDTGELLVECAPDDNTEDGDLWDDVCDCESDWYDGAEEIDLSELADTNEDIAEHVTTLFF